MTKSNINKKEGRRYTSWADAFTALIPQWYNEKTGKLDPDVPLTVSMVIHGKDEVTTLIEVDESNEECPLYYIDQGKGTTTTWIYHQGKAIRVD